MIGLLNSMMIRLISIILTVLWISACSSEDLSQSNENSIQTPVPITPATEPVLQTEVSNAVDFEAMFNLDMAILLEYQDRDGDGIHDDVDIYPDQVPGYRDPTSGQALSISSAWTEIDGHQVPNVAIEDQSLLLRGEGFSEIKTNPDSWLVFMTANGLRAQRVSLNPDGHLIVTPPVGSVSVHVVIGMSRSVEVPITYLLKSAPVLYPDQSNYLVASEVTLYGRNLKNINIASLGKDNVTLTAKTDAWVSLRLPDMPQSNILRVSAEGIVSNALALDIRHDVKLSISPELQLRSGTTLSLWYGGNEIFLSQTEQQQVSLPAHRPAILFFDVLDQTGSVEYYNRVSTVVWPGVDEVVISPSSTLMARLVNMRTILPGGGGENWLQIRNSLERALMTSAAASFYSELQQLLANGTAFPQEQRIVDVVAEYRVVDTTELSFSQTSQSSLIKAAKVTLTYKELDDVIGSTVTYNGEGTDVDEPNGGDFTYPRQTIGNEYAAFVVVPHDDFRIINPNDLIGSFSSTCSYAPDENPPSILWDSDLCVQIDGLIFASAAVYKPGLIGLTDSYQPKAADRVRRHAIPKLLDAGHMWGPGGYYLKDDKNRALCNMESCYIELLTSGYGLGYKVALTSSQKDLVDTLRIRMWAEAIVPAIISMVGSPDTDGTTAGQEAADNLVSQAKTCLYNEILKSGQLYTEMGLLRDKIRASEDKTGDDLVDAVVDAVDQTVGKWAAKFVKSELGPAFMNCVQSIKGRDVIAASIKQALPQVGGFFKFAEVLSLINNIGSVILTPEKVVFRMDSRARIYDISPRTIDLLKYDSNLTIEGYWLAEEPCTDDSSHWCPELIFRDQHGREYKYTGIDESMVSSIDYARRKITIPFSNIDVGLQQLASGPLTMKLTIEDSPDYDSYIDPDFDPDSYRKLPIPVPGKKMALLTEPKITGFKPPIAEAGSIITVLGSRFELYGDSPTYLLSDIQGNTTYTLERIPDSSDKSSQVKLRLPELLSGGEYVLTITPDPQVTTDLLALTSDTTLLVTNIQLPAVVVGEYGSLKDDFIHVGLMDANGELMRYRNTLLSMTFVLPSTYLNPPAGLYSYGLAWDDDAIDRSSEVSVDVPVRQIHVSCSSGGADSICTYGIRVLRDRLCRFGSDVGSEIFSRKITTDTTDIFYLAKDNELCSQVVPP